MGARQTGPQREARTREGQSADRHVISWDEVVDCRRCAMRRNSLFSALRGSDFAHIAPPIRHALLPLGTVIYCEEEPARAIYSIRRGVVKLGKRGPNGGERVVRLLGPGAALGLEALTEGAYWHTAMALREAELCRIPFPVIEHLQAQNSRLVDKLIGEWERYVEYADQWLTELLSGPVRSRVCRLLLILAKIGGEGYSEFTLPPLEDMAAILGTSTESVSRNLAELKRAKALERIAPHTYRLDAGALLD